MPNFRERGRVAEDRAADFLIHKGYTIVTRRYKASGGEIDLVALDGDIVVFVEVKFRNHPDYRAEDGLDQKKMEHLLSASGEYLQAMNLEERETRFDLIAIDAEGIRHHERVF